MFPGPWRHWSAALLDDVVSMPGIADSLSVCVFLEVSQPLETPGQVWQNMLYRYKIL